MLCRHKIYYSAVFARTTTVHPCLQHKASLDNGAEVNHTSSPLTSSTSASQLGQTWTYPTFQNLSLREEGVEFDQLWSLAKDVSCKHICDDSI